MRENGAGEVKAHRDKLCRISDQIQSAKKESYLVEQYRDLVEDGRQQFRKEASALLGVNPSDPSHHEPLTEEEMNIFITHAYKKVASLQQQLGKLKLLHQQIDQTQVCKQKSPGFIFGFCLWVIRKSDKQNVLNTPGFIS